MRRVTKTVLYLLAVSCLILVARVAPLDGQAGATVFEGARLITGDGSAPIENSVFIVENEPILDSGLGAPGNLKLILYGLPGTTYRIQSSPVLGPGAVWENETTVQLSGPSQELNRPVGTEATRYFRVVQ